MTKNEFQKVLRETLKYRVVGSNEPAQFILDDITKKMEEAGLVFKNEPSIIEVIESYMDKAYAKFVEDNPESDLSNLTVLISKDHFKLLENTALERLSDKLGPTANLRGYHTVNAPWGFKLAWNENVESGKAEVVDL